MCLFSCSHGCRWWSRRCTPVAWSTCRSWWGIIPTICTVSRRRRTTSCAATARCPTTTDTTSLSWSVSMQWWWSYIDGLVLKGHYINSLWPSDAIWCHNTLSILVQVMAWCLIAPSHYLNQCWLIMSEVKSLSEPVVTYYQMQPPSWINLSEIWLEIKPFSQDNWYTNVCCNMLILFQA